MEAIIIEFQEKTGIENHKELITLSILSADPGTLPK